MPEPRPGDSAHARQAAALLAAAALPPAVVLGLIGLIGGVVVAAVVFVVVAAAVAAGVWWRADSAALGAVGGAPADRSRHARLYNLVEGLCAAAGVPQPALRVVDSPALNAVAVGRGPDRATLAVTTGLLASLSRIELEGVVAEELIRIKQGETVAGTVAAGAGPLARRLVRYQRSEADDDLHAVSLTRYPPGLAGALEAMAGAETGMSRVPGSLAGLWLADPVAGGSQAVSRLPLAERVQALREL